MQRLYELYEKIQIYSRILMDKYFQNKYRIGSARLKGYDYSYNGAYFVTIVTKDRMNYFGKIENDKMILSDTGKIAENYWLEIPDHFPFVLLDEFVIMPNHIHGIIIINNDKRAKPGPCRDVACNVSTNSNVSTSITDETINNMSSISPKYGSLSSIIRSYKSAITRCCNEHKYVFGWQPRFHDHIVRNENEFYKIKEYIFNNPLNWKSDENNN